MIHRPDVYFATGRESTGVGEGDGRGGIKGQSHRLDGNHLIRNKCVGQRTGREACWHGRDGDHAVVFVAAFVHDGVGGNYDGGVDVGVVDDGFTIGIHLYFACLINAHNVDGALNDVGDVGD